MLVRALDALSGPVRLELRDVVPKALPLVDAPALPAPTGHLVLGRHPEQRGHLEVRVAGKKKSLHQVVGRAGRVVEKLTWAGSAKGERYVAVTEATPLPLSARSKSFLVRAKATRDPLHSASHEALRALLVEKGLPVHDAVLDLEETLGGLSVVDGDDPDHFAHFGAYHLLASWPAGWTLADADREAGLVAVGHLFGDEMIALDREGRVHWQEMVAMPRMWLVADDIVTFVERWLLELSLPRLGLRIQGRHGLALSDALGLAPVAEASDRHERWWQGEGIFVGEPLPYDFIVNGAPEAPSTVVRLSKASLSPGLADALVALGAKVTSDAPKLVAALKKHGLG